MQETIQKLQGLVSAVLPLLSTNLATAYNEWMSEKIARGAYEYCLSRHGTALAIVNTPASDFSLEAGLRAGAGLFIDLHTALRDVSGAERITAQDQVEALKSFYTEHGYTETCKLFGIPLKPAAAPLAA